MQYVALMLGGARHCVQLYSLVNLYYLFAERLFYLVVCLL